MFKKLGVLLVIVLLLAGGAVWYVRTNLDRLVQHALETYGSAATGTEVDVSGVHIALTTGRGTISHLKIGNPKDYVAAKALSIGNVTMQLDTNTILGTGPVVIKELSIEKPYVIYEVGANGKANLQEIQNNVAHATPAKTSNAPSRKVIIRDVYIRQGKVGITHALLKGKDIKTDLPLIHLHNIGKEGEGATPNEISKQILGQITSKSIQAGAQALQKELVNLKGLDKDALVKQANDSLSNLLHR